MSTTTASTHTIARTSTAGSPPNPAADSSASLATSSPWRPNAAPGLTLELADLDE